MRILSYFLVILGIKYLNILNYSVALLQFFQPLEKKMPPVKASDVFAIAKKESWQNKVSVLYIHVVKANLKLDLSSKHVLIFVYLHYVTLKY